MHQFILNLEKALSGILPGIEAHNSMSVQMANNQLEVTPPLNRPIPSAVLILLYPQLSSIHTVLILRQGYDGVHSNQVGFPGGKMEKCDLTLQETALREAHEEVNISPKSVSIIGKLTPIYIHLSNFAVTPFVGYCQQTPHFIPDEREVNKIITPTINWLLDPATIHTTNLFIKKYNTTLRTPYFDLYGDIVWGATAKMLAELKAIIASFR